MIDVEKIFECLPHRYPMLLVDRVLEVEATRCKGLKNVSVNEAFFQGHYPERPIMPGVLIIEAMAQAGAIMILTNSEHQGKIPLIGAIDDVRFKRLVVPGDQLISEVELVWLRGSIGKFKGVATVDGEVAASMEMTFKLQDKES